MRGDKVVIRDFKGRPSMCRVWDEDRLAVYVVTEESFRLMESQGTNAELIPAGFRKEDVFTYEPWVQQELGQEPFDWTRLRSRVDSN